jgi:hypothetical protein
MRELFCFGLLNVPRRYQMVGKWKAARDNVIKSVFGDIISGDDAKLGLDPKRSAGACLIEYPQRGSVWRRALAEACGRKLGAAV